ncbi:DUF1189 domain-containing protein [Enterococcus sp. LJL120]
MTNWKLFLASFYQFDQLQAARKIPFWKTILYALFLGVILALPIAQGVFSFVGDIQTDGTQIAAEIPDFHFENGEIVTDDTDGFIYQTDTIVFTFDPEGQRTPQEISSDLVGNLFSIGFSKNELIIAFANSDMISAVFGSNIFEIPYDNETLAQLTGADIRQMLTETQLPFWMEALVFLFLLYPVWLSLMFTLLFGGITCFLFSTLRRIRLTFFETLKISVYSATVPIILSALISFFLPSFDVSLFTMLLTLFIFSRATKSLAPKPPVIK